MLGCTFNEYKDRFEENLAKYLEAYEDNTPISFLRNQMRLYSHYQVELKKILSELIIYGEENASEIFLESNIFEGLKKMDFESYQNILIEEKPNDIHRLYARVGEYRSKLKVRINITILKNIITSVDKIVEFIENKFQIFEQDDRSDITLDLVQQHYPANDETAILDKVIPSKLDADDLVDKDKSIKEVIEFNLKELKCYLSDYDYKLLANSLLEYCKTNNFPKLDYIIMFKPINKKIVGWALKEIVKTNKRGTLKIELFKFAQQHINLFQDEVIVEVKFTKSSFYKAFTTNLN
jgi:hypothetical protein